MVGTMAVNKSGERRQRMKGIGQGIITFKQGKACNEAR